MKRRSLRRSLAWVAASFPLLVAAQLGYEVGFLGDATSSSIDLPLGMAGIAVAVIMAITKPGEFHSRREWQQFLWGLPMTCLTMGIIGYAIMWRLFGNSLTAGEEIAAWSVLVASVLIGPLFGWWRGRLFEWPKAGER